MIYWLSTLKQTFFPDTYHGPTSEQPSPFYRTVTIVKRTITQETPQLDLMKTPVTAFSEEFAIRDLTTEENGNTRKEKWTHIAKMKATTDVKEFEWRRK